MRLSFLIAGLSVTLVAAERGPASPQDLGAAQAEQLVTAYLRDRGQTHLRGFGLDRFEPPASDGFFFFSATFDNPNGSVVLGHYAVDWRTGDVWDAVICQEKHSPSMNALQRHLRHRMRMSMAEYRRLRRPGPNC